MSKHVKDNERNGPTKSELEASHDIGINTLNTSQECTAAGKDNHEDAADIQENTNTKYQREVDGKASITDSLNIINNLIKNCLEVKTKNRPTIEEILQTLQSFS